MHFIWCRCGVVEKRGDPAADMQKVVQVSSQRGLDAHRNDSNTNLVDEKALQEAKTLGKKRSAPPSTDGTPVLWANPSRSTLPT